MEIKKLLLLMTILLLFSTLSQAEVIGRKYRQAVLQVVTEQLEEIPDYVGILQFTDLSRMEFAVVLGRLLEDYPNLNNHLQSSIRNVSWELTKLGYISS